MQSSGLDRPLRAAAGVLDPDCPASAGEAAVVAGEVAVEGSGEAMRLARYASQDFDVKDSPGKEQRPALDIVGARAVHGRLQETAQNSDPSSALTAVYGPSPDRPRRRQSYWRKLVQPAILWATSEVKVTPRTALSERAGTSMVGTADSRDTLTSDVRVRRSLEVTGLLWLLLWAALIAVLVLRSAAGEQVWLRLLLLFITLQSVALAAAGLLLGAAMNRRRAERAEARAAQFEHDAIAGRALAVAAKAEESPEQVETLGSDVAPSGEVYSVAERHARTARALFH